MTQRMCGLSDAMPLIALLSLLCVQKAATIYSGPLYRDLDGADSGSYTLSPLVCYKLPARCKCSTETELVNEEMEYEFTGSVVNCSTSPIGQEGAKYFEALQRVLEEASYKSASLTKIDFSSSSVSQLILSGTYNNLRVKMFALNDNPLSALSRLFFSDLAIEYLQLRRTQLQRLTKVVSLGIRNLRAIDLSFNRLTIIESDAFVRANLRYLNLSANPQLQVRPNSFSGLESYLELIDLSATNLQAIPNAFEGFRKLRFLHLKHNRIASIGAAEMQLLPCLVNTVYHFEHNQMTWIDPTAFVQHNMPFIMYADNNRISDLSFLHLHNPCKFMDVGVSVQHNEVFCSCSLLKFLAFNTAVIEGKCRSPSIVNNLNFRHFRRADFLEELFKDPYFAALERRCHAEMTKNDSFASCRCSQSRVMSKLLLRANELEYCLSAAPLCRPLPAVLLHVLLVFVLYLPWTRFVSS